MQVEDESGKEAAAEAKQRAAVLFARADKEGYEKGCAAYAEAEAHDPSDHVFPSNICACQLELCKLEWEPAKKVEHSALALVAAARCVALNPAWTKGFVRKAAAEAELLAAVATFEKRKSERKESLDYDDKPWPEPPASLLPGIQAASHASCEVSCRAGLALERGNAPLRLRLQLLRDAGHVGADKEGADRALADAAAAAPLKAEGNAAFAAKRYSDAADKYTAALSHDPFDHIFYSNRSACYAGLEEAEHCASAMRDADTCLLLMPTFAKAHSRRSVALYGLGRYVEAEAAAEAGLALDPGSAPLKELLATARVETAETLEVQGQMHAMRQKRSKDEKMKKMLSGLNLGGNVQMFNGMGGLGGLGGGGLEGLFGGGGMGGMGAPAQTDAQMRQMARAVAGASGKAEAHGHGHETRDEGHAHGDGCCGHDHGDATHEHGH